MTGDDAVRLTYTELAEMRGISLASARRMVHRHKWPKQVGNDGLPRVSVPASALARPETATNGTTNDTTNDTVDDARDDISNGATDDAITDIIPGVMIGASPVQVVLLDEAVTAFAKATTDAITGAIYGATRDAMV